MLSDHDPYCTQKPLEAIVDDKPNVDPMMIYVFDCIESIRGKGENADKLTIDQTTGFVP